MNKKNKVKRYLAGLLTVLMIFQQSGMNSILADSDEIPAAFVSEEELSGYEVPEYEGQAQEEGIEEEPVTEEVVEEEPMQPEITEIPEPTATPEPEQTEVPKTDFSYEDGSIYVTAQVEESAWLPQDAQLKVENLLNMDPQRYEGEKSEMNSLFGINGENFTAEYLLYDIYFWSETAGGRIEPADGTVRVQMNFADPQLEMNEQEQIAQSNLKVYVNRQEDTAAQFDTNEAKAVQGAAFSTMNMGTVAVVRVNEIKKNEQLVYTYEDSEVVVTATLAAPDAVPDEAEFRVTRVTPQTVGYNYDVYMQALNNNAEMITPDNSANMQAGDIYTEKNTLLYDIAFLVDKTDENGNEISGEKEEYQPIEGAVNISFDFKKSQLTQEVEAEKAEEISVVHLPLDEATKETVDTTADATEISAGNINVEVVSDAAVQLETEAADFDLNDFSLVAFVNVNGQELNPGTPQDYMSILGNAIYYGVTANTINKDAHMDTNFATKYFTGGGNVTAGAYTGNNGDSNNGGVYVIADMGSDSSLKIDGKNSDVWCTEAIKNRLDLEVNGKGQKKIFDKGVLEAYVNNLITNVASVSANMAFEKSYQVKNQNEVMNQAEIDISERPDGTYYIDGDWLNDTGEGALRIKKRSGQTIIFNYMGTSVNLKRFDIWDTDRESGYMQSTTSGASADQYARTVVFNMPNATDVTFASGMFGIFLAPNATVHGLGGTSSGWLVVDTLDKNSSEWHCVWSDMPDSDRIPVPAQLTATKTVNGDRPGDDERFEFKLEEYDKETRKWAQVEILPNKGTFVTFTSRTYQADGQYYYRISEYGDVDGYIKDDTVYIAMITVSSSSQISGDTMITSYKIDSVKYYRASDLEEITEDNLVSAATFDNTRQEDEKIKTSVYKEWDDAENQDGKRPPSILVQLYANGQKQGEPVVLNDENGWSYGWTDLPVKQNGETVVYSVKEAGRIPGYECTVNGDVQTGFVITNSHIPEKTEISGEKIWDDAENQDGKRPESITVNLFANGEKIDSKVVKEDAEGNWKYSFKNLPKYANGEQINYTVTEDTVTDYTTEITGTTIINKYQPGKTSVTVTKAWEDFNDHNGIRPSEIKVQLYADGEAKGEEITLNAESQWTYIWTDLDERKAGELIDYTVKETENSDDYETTISGDAHTGYIITNILKTGNLELKKLITGDLSDEKLTAEEKEALTFTITGPYDYQETVHYSDFTDGKYLLSSLPLGQYQVIEANAKIPGYILTTDYSVEEGTAEILCNETAAVTITNNYETTSVKIGKVDITSHEELEGAHLQIIDQEGNIVDEWDSTKTAHETIGLRAGETYILRETVAPDDYNITSDTTFELNEDGTINTQTTTTTIEDGILLVEDTMKEYSDADLTVTKHLTTDEGEDIYAVDQTFYVALYADEDCTERVSDIKPLVFQNASASFVTFTKLEKDHTYYVGECDEYGTSYLSNVTADGILYTVEFNDGNVVEIDNPDGSKAIYFDNQFEEIPDNFYRDGKLTITKKLLRADGKAKNSSQTFYAGIFADEEYTQFAEEAAEKIVALDLAGNSQTSKTITIALPKEGDVTLYVTEVDSNGKPVDGAAGFKYKVSVENAEITMNQENYKETVEITNKETAITPTPKPSSTPTPTVTPRIPNSSRSQKTPGSFTGTSTRTAVKTGDTTSIDGFIALLAAAAVVTAAGVYFKRRKEAK